MGHGLHTQDCLATGPTQHQLQLSKQIPVARYTILPDNRPPMHPPPAQPGFRLHDMTILHAQAGVPMPGGGRQRHNHHELVYVVRGDYEVATLGLTLRGREGSAFCFRPGQDHSPSFPPGRPGREHCQAILLQWSQPSGTPPCPLQLHDSSGRLLHVLSWMYDLHQSQDAADRAAAAQLLPLLVRELHRPADQGSVMLQSVHTYIDDHLAEPIRLQDLADAVGMSRFHFSRRFAEAAGVSPMEYVARLRVQKAAELLRTTPLPLAQIARRVGLSSAFHLSNRFVAQYGQRPTAWRKAHAAGD